MRFTNIFKGQKTVKELTMILSQRSTDKPEITDLKSDFGDVTFYAARSDAGIYTITASQAIFIRNKTVAFIQHNLAALNKVDVAVTSQTVITIKTGVLSFSGGNIINTGTDEKLNNALLSIQIIQ